MPPVASPPPPRPRPRRDERCDPGDAGPRRGEPQCAAAATAAARKSEYRQDDALQPALRHARQDGELPGTTTDLRVGRLQMPLAAAGARPLEVVDLPGLYSLELDLPRVDRRGPGAHRRRAVPPAAAIVVADATNLSRHLMLVGELARQAVPFVVALNMIDLAHGRGLTFDLEKMSRRHRRAGGADRGAQRQGGRRADPAASLGLRRAALSRGSEPAGRAGRPRPDRERRGAPGARGPRALGRDRRRRERRRRAGGGQRQRHGARPARRDLHPPDPRADHLSPRDGRAVLGDLRRRQRADGPDRGDLRPTWAVSWRPGCRPARCATCSSAG